MAHILYDILMEETSKLGLVASRKTTDFIIKKLYTTPEGFRDALRLLMRGTVQHRVKELLEAILNELSEQNSLYRVRYEEVLYGNPYKNETDDEITDPFEAGVAFISHLISTDEQSLNEMITIVANTNDVKAAIAITAITLGESSEIGEEFVFNVANNWDSNSPLLNKCLMRCLVRLKSRELLPMPPSAVCKAIAKGLHPSQCTYTLITSLMMYASFDNDDYFSPDATVEIIENIKKMVIDNPVVFHSERFDLDKINLHAYRADVLSALLLANLRKQEPFDSYLRTSRYMDMLLNTCMKIFHRNRFLDMSAAPLSTIETLLDCYIMLGTHTEKHEILEQKFDVFLVTPMILLPKLRAAFLSIIKCAIPRFNVFANIAGMIIVQFVNSNYFMDAKRLIKLCMNYIFHGSNIESAPAFQIICFFIEQQNKVDPKKEIMYWFIKTYAARMCHYLVDKGIAIHGVKLITMMFPYAPDLFAPTVLSYGYLSAIICDPMVVAYAYEHCKTQRMEIESSIALSVASVCTVASTGEIGIVCKRVARQARVDAIN